MTTKYFKTEDGAWWRLWETQDPWGTQKNFAVELDSTTAVMLGTEDHASYTWEYLEDTADLEIDDWFLQSNAEDLFNVYEEYPTDVVFENRHKPTLKEMLENLKNDPTYIDDGTCARREAAEDILGLIRARQEIVEMPHTVVLSAKKYPDSASLENAIKDMKQQHGDDAHILVSTTPAILAETYLATLKNKETIGISSYPDTSKPLGVTLDPDALEVIKKLKPKK